MNGQHHGGKGSAQRPVDQEKFNNNWDAIYGSEVHPDHRKQKYIALLEPKWVASHLRTAEHRYADIDAFIFEALDIEDAKQIVEKKDLGDYEVYVQAINSVWLNNFERKNKIF